MPTGVVDNEHDGSINASAGLACEGFEHCGEERVRHAVVHVSKGLAAGRRHEGRHVKPIEAMMAGRDRPFADGRPNASRHRLQPEPMFVAREDLDRPLRMLLGFLGRALNPKAARSAHIIRAFYHPRSLPIILIWSTLHLSTYFGKSLAATERRRSNRIADTLLVGNRSAHVWTTTRSNQFVSFTEYRDTNWNDQAQTFTLRSRVATG